MAVQLVDALVAYVVKMKADKSVVWLDAMKADSMALPLAGQMVVMLADK